MIHQNITSSMFDKIAIEFVDALGPEASLQQLKRFIVGAIIDDCHHNGKVMVYNGCVYTVENNNRSGDLWNALTTVKAETVGEWMARVELGLLP